MDVVKNYKELKENKVADKRGGNNLANVFGKKFKDRFGTATSRKNYGKGNTHKLASFRSKQELDSWKRLIKQFCESTKCDYKQMQDFKTIYTNREDIFNFVHERYHNNEISILTLAGEVNRLATMCLYHDPFNKDVRIIANTMFSYASKMQRAEHDERYGNNELKEESKYIPFATLVEERNKLEPVFMALKFKGFYPTNTKDFNKHFAYLKLALNTYYPPLRLEFQHMQYVVSNTPPVNEKITQNYLYYDEKKDLFSIVINQDKLTSKSTREISAQQIFHLNVNTVYMNCDKLSTILKHSFTSYPRLYVFPNYRSTSTPNGLKWDNGKNIGSARKVKKMFPYRGYAYIVESNYTDLLKPYFKHTPTQNNLRQAYHTYYEKVHRPHLTNRELTDIAKRMRHSLGTARKAYVINAPDPQQITKEMKNDEEIQQEADAYAYVQAEKKVKELKIKDMKAYHKAYNQKYFDNPYNRVRNSDNKYLNYIRSGKIKNPKESVLEKHGIHKVNDIYTFTPEKLLERKKS